MIAIPGVLAYYNQRIIARSQVEKSKADIAMTYQRVALDAATEALGLREELRLLKVDIATHKVERDKQIAILHADYEKKIDDLRLAYEKGVSSMREKYDCVLLDNGDLREWAERLVNQVQVLGGMPVKIRTRKVNDAIS